MPRGVAAIIAGCSQQWLQAAANSGIMQLCMPCAVLVRGLLLSTPAFAVPFVLIMGVTWIRCVLNLFLHTLCGSNLSLTATWLSSGVDYGF
jgi:hypothetical protein